MDTLTFGFSPCPNDTFIFDAIVNNKIDTDGLKFKFIIEDVEHLNKEALNNNLDITKISYNAFSKMTQNYQMMRSGGALGSNCGPLLISSKPDIEINPNSTVAIPGFNTTANLLLELAYPELINKKEYLFSDIEKAVINREVDFGLIIHESRFTYQSKGLYKIMDLGEYWEQKTKSPIPLGGICIKRSLDLDLKQRVNAVINKSVAHAFENKADTLPYVRKYAQELNEEVMMAHIDLYVNHFTLDLEEQGIKGVQTFFKTLKQQEKITTWTKPLVVPLKSR